MPTYVTAEGLQIPSLTDLQTKIGDDQRANVDPLLNTEPDSPQGQINGIISNHLREAWEVIGLVFNSYDPDQGEGSLLENVSAISGTLRAPSTASTLKGSRAVTLNLDLATTVDKGTIFSVDGNPAIKFQTTAAVISTAAGDYPADCECLDLGPIACNSGTLTVIDTPVSGLNSVTNDFDAVLGQLEDSDAGLRIRRESELRERGGAAVDAVRADLLAITDDDGAKPVLQCSVFENITDDFDSLGLPPHSMEALVFDGLTPSVENDTIAQTIWDSKPGGVRMVGNTSGTATDSEGNPHTIYFSRPDVLEFDFAITIETDPKTYEGDEAAKAAVVARFLKDATSGTPIRATDYIAALKDDIAGVKDVTNLQIGLHGGTLGGNLVNYPLATREIGSTQASFVTLTVT